MKVLGIAGSPRRRGNTDLLLAEFMKGAAGQGAEVKTIPLNNLRITPCQHCDACQEKGRCKIQDDMQPIYEEMAEADVLVLASPIHFMGLSAQMKAFVDRCQALWARKYVLKIPPLGTEKKKTGFLIAVGGTQVKNLFEPVKTTVKVLFISLDVTYGGELTFPGIDKKGDIAKHPDALKEAFLAGQKSVEGVSPDAGTTP